MTPSEAILHEKEYYAWCTCCVNNNVHARITRVSSLRYIRVSSVEKSVASTKAIILVNLRENSYTVKNELCHAHSKCI